MQPKLKRWIRARIETLPSAARFELVHGSMGDELVLLRFERESIDLDELSASRAEDAWQAASEHAEAYESKQRFRLLAFCEDGTTAGTLVFAVGQGSTTQAFSVRTDIGEATEKGLLGQLMRHNQQLAAINVESVQAVLSPLISENQDLRRRIGEVEGRRLEMFHAMEALETRRHEREIESAESATRAEFRAKMLKSLADRWVPELLAKIDLGGKGNPRLGASDPMSAAQSTLRDALAVVDRETIALALDADGRRNLNSLCGLGESPRDMPAFRSQLRRLWESLPDDVTESLVTRLETRPDLAARLASMMGDDAEHSEAAN